MVSTSTLLALATLTDVVDRYGDCWTLYLWRVNTDDLDRSGRTHWVVWVALAPDAEPTGESLNAADRAGRTVSMRLGKGFDPAAHDIGHAFWRSRELGMTGERPFVAGSEMHARIVDQTRVVLDALLETGRVP